MQLFNLASIFLFLYFLFLLRKFKNSNNQTKKLPPGPWKLPFIGSMHHLIGGHAHQILRELAKKYGPLMHLQLGEVTTIVVTSSEVAKQVLKTHDLAFSSRPKMLVTDIITYDSSDIAFSPYGEISLREMSLDTPQAMRIPQSVYDRSIFRGYWRQMRKISVTELLSAKNVQSLSSMRHDEVVHLIESIRLSSSSGEPVNFTESMVWFTSSIICRSAFGTLLKKQDIFIKVMREVLKLADQGFDMADIFPSYKFLHGLGGVKKEILDVHHKVDELIEEVINEHKKNFATHKTSDGEDLIGVLLRLMKDKNLEFPITNQNIKAIIFGLFVGGTETSSTTVVWAMAEMMKNPKIFDKAQAEVRRAFRDKIKFDIYDVEELKYLKLVVKETLRLHPPIPLGVPRECREETDINGYTIPVKTKIIINVWALGRDPKYWDDAESFKPERFEESSVDFIGNNFEFLPFGGGRRVCPGILFGLANVYLALAQLLYHFDWKLPNGMDPSDLDLIESGGLTVSRKNDLYLIATPYQP